MGEKYEQKEPEKSGNENEHQHPHSRYGIKPHHQTPSGCRKRVNCADSEIHSIFYLMIRDCGVEWKKGKRQ